MLEKIHVFFQFHCSCLHWSFNEDIGEQHAGITLFWQTNIQASESSQTVEDRLNNKIISIYINLSHKKSDDKPQF